MGANRSRLLAPIGGGVLFAAGFLVGWWAGAGGDPHSPGGRGGEKATDHREDAMARKGEEESGKTGKAEKEEAEGGEAPASKTGEEDEGWEEEKGASVRTSISPPPAPRPASVEPPPPYVLPEKIRGRLVDAITGKPIPGASVSLLWQTNDGTLGGGMSADMAEDGSWTADGRDDMREYSKRLFLQLDEYQRRKYRSPEDLFADLEYGIRASAKGYETVEGPEPGEETEFRLVPEGRDRLPGAVRVDARWSDGNRYPGRLLAHFGWHDREGFSQWAWPESDGTFLFVGVPAGPWSVIAAGKHCTGNDVKVPESGEVRVALRVPRKGLEEADDVPSGDPREVEVSLGGLQPGAGAFVRAEARKGLFFRSEAVGGVAVFGALPAGKWEFVLQAPDVPEARFAADVEPGSGRLSLRFPALAVEPR